MYGNVQEYRMVSQLTTYGVNLLGTLHMHADGLRELSSSNSDRLDLLRDSWSSRRLELDGACDGIRGSVRAWNYARVTVKVGDSANGSHKLM